MAGRDALFRQTEVCDLQVSLKVEQYVFWLEVSVNDFILMQMPNRFHHLRRIKASTSLRELVILSQMIEQFAAVAEVHHEVQLQICLERIVQFDDERVFDFFEDVSLRYTSTKSDLPCVLIIRLRLATTSLLSVLRA